MGTLQGSLEQKLYLFVPPSAAVQACCFVILKPGPPTTRKPNSIFSTLSISVSVRDEIIRTKQLLKVVHGGKIFSNVHSNQDSSRTANHS